MVWCWAQMWLGLGPRSDPSAIESWGQHVIGSRIQVGPQCDWVLGQHVVSRSGTFWRFFCICNSVFVFVCTYLWRSAFLTLFFWICLLFLQPLCIFSFFLCCCFGCWQLCIVGHACAAHAMRSRNLQICQFRKQLHTHTVTVIHHHAMTTTTGWPRHNFDNMDNLEL